MNTPAYTHPKYPNLFPNKLCYKKILTKTHPNFHYPTTHIHNERCMVTDDCCVCVLRRVGAVRGNGVDSLLEVVVK